MPIYLDVKNGLTFQGKLGECECLWEYFGWYKEELARL